MTWTTDWEPWYEANKVRQPVKLRRFLKILSSDRKLLAVAAGLVSGGAADGVV